METTSIESLQYPIGRFQKPGSFTNDTITQLIDEIEGLPPQLRAEVEALSDAQLDTPYRPEGWTIRQVVHHLPDSHMNAYVRFKLTVTEDNPVIKPYLEGLWAELPDGKSALWPCPLNLLENLHHRWVVFLRQMTPAQWDRTYVHPEYHYQISLKNNLALYAWHCKHHLAHVTNTIDRNGW